MKKFFSFFAIVLMLSNVYGQSLQLTPDTSGTISGVNTTGRTHYFTSPMFTQAWGYAIEVSVTPGGTAVSDSTRVQIQGSTDGTTYVQLTQLGPPQTVGTAKYYSSVATGARLSSEGTDKVTWIWTPSSTTTWRYIRVKVTQYKAGSALTVNTAKIHLFKILTSSGTNNVNNMYKFNNKAPDFYVDTINDQNVHGIKTFYDPPAFTLGTKTTNVAMGYRPLFSITTGEENFAAGDSALFHLTTGKNNIAIGYKALNSLTTYEDVIGIGRYSGYNTTTGHTIAIGSRALYSNTTGSNIAIGGDAGQMIGQGSGNVIIGHSAFQSKNGSLNTIIGSGAGNRSSGSGSVLIGYNAGYYDKGGSLIIHNSSGGADTALICGTFGYNGPGSQTLQINGSLQLTRGDTLITAPFLQIGAIVYKTSDKHFYGCKNIGSGKKWYQLDN